MEDGTGHAEKLLGLDGVRILDVEERSGELVVTADHAAVPARDRCDAGCAGSTSRRPGSRLEARLGCACSPTTGSRGRDGG